MISQSFGASCSVVSIPLEMDIWGCEDEKFPIFYHLIRIRKGLLEQSVFYDCPSPCKEVQYEEEKNEIASKEMSNRKWTFKHEGKEC